VRVQVVGFNLIEVFEVSRPLFVSGGGTFVWREVFRRRFAKVNSHTNPSTFFLLLLVNCIS